MNVINDTAPLTQGNFLNDLLSTLARFTIRIVLLAMGLVFALSLLCAAAVLGVFWWLRLLWAKATGRPVQAWVFRIDPRAGWNRFYQARDPWSAARGPQDAGPPQADAPGDPPERPLTASADWRERRPKDVTDVEPK